MNIKKILVLIFLCTSLFIFTAYDNTENKVIDSGFGDSLIIYKDMTKKIYTSEEKERIISMIHPSAVIADIVESSPVYKYCYEDSGIIGQLSPGDKVEILQDRSTQWYEVKMPNGAEVWVKHNILDIPEDEPAIKQTMTKNELEEYMYVMDFESKTNYFILTDISRQQTHVFIGERGNWELLKTMTCSSGINISPTTRGNFEISTKGKWFYSERLQSGGMYWVRFNNTYLFHSVAMDKNQNIVDGILGEKRSMGCIRLSVEDAQWFYEVIPEKTSVCII